MRIGPSQPSLAGVGWLGLRLAIYCFLPYFPWQAYKHFNLKSLGRTLYPLLLINETRTKPIIYISQARVVVEFMEPPPAEYTLHIIHYTQLSN